MILGILGTKVWHRCRYCGWEYAADDTYAPCPACGHVDVEEEEDEED
jgi:rubrerythrin